MNVSMLGRQWWSFFVAVALTSARLWACGPRSLPSAETRSVGCSGKTAFSTTHPSPPRRSIPRYGPTPWTHRCLISVGRSAARKVTGPACGKFRWPTFSIWTAWAVPCTTPADIPKTPMKSLTFSTEISWGITVTIGHLCYWLRTRPGTNWVRLMRLQCRPLWIGYWVSGMSTLWRWSRPWAGCARRDNCHAWRGSNRGSVNINNHTVNRMCCLRTSKRYKAAQIFLCTRANDQDGRLSGKTTVIYKHVNFLNRCTSVYQNKETSKREPGLSKWCYVLGADVTQHARHCSMIGWCTRGGLNLLPWNATERPYKKIQHAPHSSDIQIISQRARHYWLECTQLSLNPPMQLISPHNEHPRYKIPNTVASLISQRSCDSISTVPPHWSFGLLNRIEWHKTVAIEPRDCKIRERRLLIQANI